MKTKIILKVKANQSGFSLMEIIASLAISALFVALSASVVRDIFQITEKDKQQLDAETDLTFATRYLTGVLKDAGPSFNSIKGNLDDNNLEFFDLLHDVSTVGWDKKYTTRTLTLDPTKGRLDFFFIVNSNDQIDQIFYTPLDAYVPPDPVESMDASATLTYSALNKDDAISKYNPGIWKENNLILLKVPIPLRFISVDGSVNMDSPPREHTFLGRVSGNNLAADNFLDHAYKTHPIDNSPVESADTFLRTVPTVGGASPVIEVINVNAYKVSLVKRGAQNKYDLYSYRYANGAYTMPFMIAANIKTVTFKREIVGLPLIGVRIAIEKLSK